MSAPIRIQLSRKKGWEMPPNTVKVDRTTKWGNPFIVGKHGGAKDCVHLFRVIMETGGLCVGISKECFDAQKKLVEHAKKNFSALRGKNLACWCKPGSPCHADVLLELSNQ